jgi:hypothetical protein
MHKERPTDFGLLLQVGPMPAETFNFILIVFGIALIIVPRIETLAAIIGVCY